MTEPAPLGQLRARLNVAAKFGGTVQISNDGIPAMIELCDTLPRLLAEIDRLKLVNQELQAAVDEYESRHA